MLALMEGRFDDAEALIEETRRWRRSRELERGRVRARRAVRAAPRAGPARGARRHDQRGRCTSTRRCCASAARWRTSTRRARAASTRRGAVLRDVLRRDLGSEYLDAEWLFSMACSPTSARSLGRRRAPRRSSTRCSRRTRAYTQWRRSRVSSARWPEASASSPARWAPRRRRAPPRGRDRARAPDGRAPVACPRPEGLRAALLARAGPRDAERAQELLDAAIASFRELGMDHWAERTRATTSSG